METKYVKVADSLYEVKYKRRDEKVITLALSTQPKLADFVKFCDTLGLHYEVNYITKYCNRSMVMHHAVFEN